MILDMKSDCGFSLAVVEYIAGLRTKEHENLLQAAERRLWPILRNKPRICPILLATAKALEIIIHFSSITFYKCTVIYFLGDLLKL